MVKLLSVAGVYCLENTCTGDCYVGSSDDMRSRIWCHLTGLRHDKHHSIRMQTSFDWWGEDAFEARELERAPVKLSRAHLVWWLYARELHYHRTLKPALNMAIPILHNYSGKQYREPPTAALLRLVKKGRLG